MQLLNGLKRRKWRTDRKEGKISKKVGLIPCVTGITHPKPKVSELPLEGVRNNPKRPTSEPLKNSSQLFCHFGGDFLGTNKALSAIVTREDSVVLVDSETGEVLDSSTSATVKYKSGAPYIKFYHRNPLFHEKMPKTARILLMALGSMIPYSSSADPAVFVGGDKRKEIIEQYDLSESTLKRSLSWLCQHKYLRKASKGCYEVNPYLFAKGSSASVLKRQKEWDKEDEENAT